MGKKTNSNIICVVDCLEKSLAQVLHDANDVGVISFNKKFSKIFMNNLAENLWYNNPLHPERQHISVCNMPFVVGDDGNGLPRLPCKFSLCMTQEQAVIIIQVFLN